MSMGKGKAVLRWQFAAGCLLLGLALWLPRGLALDRFVTADEHAWLTRSGNFYRALAAGDWAATFQRHHPGVTVTWAGTLGFLNRYPDYAADAPRDFGWLTEEIEPFLRSQGQEPIDLLAAGRGAAVAVITVTLLTAFVVAVKLLGLGPALAGFLLIAFDPFHIGLSRLLHLDGLLSSFALLTLLSFLAALEVRRWPLLIVSGGAAGLAWLTRSPGLMLVPFVAIVAIWELWRTYWVHADEAKNSAVDWRLSAYHFLGQPFRMLIVWGLIGCVLFVLLWPAMWVEPVGSVRQILSAAQDYAEEGHLKPIFFAGQRYLGDPGTTFYLRSFLWRTTPLVLIGLLLAMGALVMGMTPLDQPTVRRTAGWLLLFALSFGLLMTLGAKKFDRYLLTAHLPLDLLAGLGWCALAAWVAKLVRVRQRGGGIEGLCIRPEASLLLVVLAIQAGLSLQTFPYYLSYYNQLMGGVTRAPAVMMIGWGEGGDQAAAFLAQQPNAAAQTVASAYTNGPFSYFYPGTTLPITFWHRADFAVVYVQDWQRRLPAPRQMAWFESLTPLHTVTINDIEYARVYDMRRAPLPDYMTEWGGQIRLVSYELPAVVVEPGLELPMTFYLENLAPTQSNLSVIVRLVGQDGEVLVREQVWPYGGATTTWRVGDVWPDGHVLTLPPNAADGYYRLDVGFYEPEERDLLPAVQSRTGDLLGEYAPLDFVRIGRPGTQPTVSLPLNANLSNQVRLIGANLDTLDEENASSSTSGKTISLRLVWAAMASMEKNYTVFVHVVGADGQMVTQHDQPPLGGFLPTSRWVVGQTVVDSYLLDLPPNVPAESVTIFVGLYELATGDRLPLLQEGEVIGDAVEIRAADR